MNEPAETAWASRSYEEEIVGGCHRPNWRHEHGKNC